MVSVCLPSDALSQQLLSYLGFSYLGHGVSLHGCSSKAQLLLLTLNKLALPDLEHGVAPLCPPVPAPATGPWTWGCSSLSAAAPDLRQGVAPLVTPVPLQSGGSQLPPLTLGMG